MSDVGTILEGFDRLASAFSSCFWVYEVEENRFTYVSPSSEQVWERSRESLYADSSSGIESVHPQDRAGIAAAFAETRAGRFGAAEYRILLPDGAVRWIRGLGAPVRTRDGAVRRIVGQAQDITDQKRAEVAVREAHDQLEGKVAERTAELAAAREQLQKIADSLPALIGLVDTDERFVFGNAAYEKWFEIPLEKLRGTPVRDVIGEAVYAVMQPYIRRVLSGEPVTYDGELTDGDTRYFHIDLVPHFDPQGQVRGFHVLAQDQTPQRRAEQELRRNERLASLGTLAAGIAHEINNPIGVILLAAEAGLAAPSDGRAVTKVLRDVARNARRCATIVQNVLTFSRERSSRKEVGDLNPLVGRAWTMVRDYAAQHGVKADFMLSEEEALVLMNPTEIEQAVVILVRNSVQAKARRIEIRTEVGDCVRLLLSDDGKGIPPEHRARLFEPFYTGRRLEGGTGLGLSILHGIVREHRGSVGVEGAPGRGATIVLSFPRAGRPGDPARGGSS